MFIIRSIFEAAIILFAIWAVFHEEKIAKQEKRLIAKIRATIKKLANIIIG